MRKLSLLGASVIVATGAFVMGLTGTAVASMSHTPSVRSVVPDHGSVNGGTTVTITGKNVVGVTGVDFGSSPAGSFFAKSNSTIVAVSPAGTGTVDISVTTGDGTSAAVPADQFTYVTTPAIQSVSPKAGASTGGNRVTIAGSDFLGATAVDFGSTPATSYVVDSAQAITAISPAASVGQVDITVTGPDGTSPIDPADQYTFALRVPKVTSVSPDVGPAGSSTTITGSGFTKVTAVDFGSTPAVSYTVDRRTKSITAVTPLGSGTVDVTVTTAKGTSIVTPVDEFTYTPSD